MPYFKIITLGCKVNQFESETIARYLFKNGWERSLDDRAADLVIINTCTVTGKASMQSRQAIRQVIKANSEARIMVTGCYAQTEPGEIEKIPGVHDIIGHGFKHKIPEMLSDHGFMNRPSSPKLISGSIGKEAIFREFPARAIGTRTRPFLKIQDGCNSFCTYCIVPHARGRSRSMTIGRVMEKIHALKENGYKEVVLTGIHLGCYGMDLPASNGLLIDLLRRIEDEKPIKRLRLSSVEPHELSDAIIDLAASSDIICPHFHIPLQSGDDHILKKMHRPYSSEMFASLVLNIKQHIPRAAIGTDLIMGFPGESDEIFGNTMAMVNDLPLSYFHVFPFSPRAGTPAAKFPNHVHPAIVKERCKKIRSIGVSKRAAFFTEFLGKNMPVLIEEKREKKSGLLRGITPNYITVLVQGPDSLKNQIVMVRLDKIRNTTSVSGSPTD